MTLINMIKRVLLQMGEDAGANEVSEYRALITDYINEAYLEICREKKQKYRQETIEFSNGRISMSQLANDVVRIIEILDINDCMVPFEVVADQIFINEIENKVYKVSYLYLPVRIILDGDIPDISESECNLLVDFATYRGLGLGDKDRQKRAEFFLMRYLSGYSALGARHGRMTNKY